VGGAAGRGGARGDLGRGGVIIAWHEAREGIRRAEGDSAMSDGDKRRPQGRGLLDDGGLVDTSRMAAGVVLRRRLNGLLRRQAELTSGLSAKRAQPASKATTLCPAQAFGSVSPNGKGLGGAAAVAMWAIVVMSLYCVSGAPI
jgi:hypothetical protein